MLLLWQMGMCWIAHIVRQGALGLEVVLTSLSLWVLPGAADRESCAGSNPFLPEQHAPPQSPLCHCFCSPSQRSLQGKLLWACLDSDISLPKETNCISSWGRKLNIMGVCHLGCGKTQAPEESLGIYHSNTQIGVHKDTNLLL